MALGQRFTTALLPRLFRKNSRSHHKGTAGRVLSGDQLLPVLCYCQLGQDITIIWLKKWVSGRIIPKFYNHFEEILVIISLLLTQGPLSLGLPAAALTGQMQVTASGGTALQSPPWSGQQTTKMAWNASVFIRITFQKLTQLCLDTLPNQNLKVHAKY